MRTVLPQARDRYDRETFQQLLNYAKELSENAYQKGQHVEIYTPPDVGSRQQELILRSPDGSRWAVRVDNAGILSATAVP